MLSYTYLSFEGGHDSLWELGGQLRKPMRAEAAAGGRPFWIGGEVAFSRLNTVIDVPDNAFDLSAGTNGFSVTALAGLPPPPPPPPLPPAGGVFPSPAVATAL